MNVFITSPSRVGSNWLCDIIVDLLKATNVLRLVGIKELFDTPHKISKSLLYKFDSLKGNNVFKLHIWKPKELVNIVKSKVVGVTRNLNDSTNSLLDAIKWRSNLDISLEKLRKQRKKQIQKHKDMTKDMNYQHENYHLVHYEDLLENPLSTINKLCEFLEIKRQKKDLEMIISLNRLEYKKKINNTDKILEYHQREKK